MTEKKAPPTPYDDARWHLARARRALSWPWPFRLLTARHHLEQARLAVNAIEELEGTAEVERLHK